MPASMHDNEPDNVHQGHSRPAPVTQDSIPESNTGYQQYSSQRTSQSPSFGDRRPEAGGDYSDSDSTDLKEEVRHSGSDFDFDFEDIHEMSARPPLHRPTEGRSQVPLLKDEQRGRQTIHTAEDEDEDDGDDEERARISSPRRSTFRSRTPDYDAKHATRRKYTYAIGFLLLCLVSFTVQTETAVYVQHNLGWEKPYCMLYLTHGSWSLLWPAQLLILRLQKRKLSWEAFWRRHSTLIWSTAQMVESGDLHLTVRDSYKSPIRYMIKSTAFITSALTIAGGSWYLAVNMTTASDLTAIYNCSAFFAYAFSIPLLHDKLRFDKVGAVIVAIVGVLIVAYGDTGPTNKSPDGTVGKPSEEASHRTLGNIIIGVGSVLYGLYEVLYKKYACPPEGTSPGRGTIFANTFASFIGLFTLLVLWIPLPLLHISGLEVFEWPRGETFWFLMISVLSNATFSGSFLVLISLTSPVLSSVAALLTIFLVAIVDWLLWGQPLSLGSIIGGILIIVAFLLLSWSTYREMDEERRKRLEDEGPDSDDDV